MKNIISGQKYLIRGIIVMAMMCTLLLSGCGKTTVDINKYAKVEITGYNGHAQAIVNFDYDSFIGDYKDKIKYAKNFGKDEELAFAEAFYDSAAETLVYELIFGSFNKCLLIKS